MSRARYLLAPLLASVAVTVPALAFAQTGDGKPKTETSLPASPAEHQQAPRRVQRSAARAPLFKRGYASFSGGYQATTNSFTNSWTYEYFAEHASVSASYPVKPAFLVDVGGGIRVFRDLSVGAALSHYTRSDAAAITASVPHPFFLNEPRSLSGAGTGPGRTETAVHIQAMWTIAAAPKVQMGLFGGPTVFRLRQVLITDLNYAESYPYDTVALSGVTTAGQSSTKVGFNAGTDVTVLLYKQFGVGAFVRYSAVTIRSTGPDGSPLSLKAGGVQGGVGFRVRF